MKFEKATHSFCLLLILTACGGGGGSDGSSTSLFTTGTGFSRDISDLAMSIDGSGDLYVLLDRSNGHSYDGVPIGDIVRLNRDGSLDSGFLGGVFDTSFSRPLYTMAVATDGSGRIYVGGDFLEYSGTPINRLIRLNPDGSLDSSFDVGTGFNGSVNSIAVTDDGSGDIYVGGNFSTYNGISANRIIRLNSDGSRDIDFNIGTGFVFNPTGTRTPFPSVSYIALANDGSGDVYVGGLFTSYRGNPRNGIVRINADGSNDGGFDSGSGFDVAVNDVIYCIVPAVDGSGDIYVCGGFDDYRGNTRNNIVRINSDGSNDAGFDPGSGFSALVTSIAVLTDGSGDLYSGGGFVEYQGLSRSMIARIHSDGSDDSTFVTGTGFDTIVMDLALATDGSLYVGGHFTDYNGTSTGRIIRLDLSGSPN